ncbi:hypothetical protein HZA76_01165 [Candidatus Roizmanbacteria bacterium]|nr:hypothetical protein [Candidatus Roizmanbacteria bacterium]
MRLIKKYWLLLTLFIISFILFSWKLAHSTSFQGDLGRDLYEIAKISFGNITLLGPKGSFGGIYTTPYYFYMFVPAFLAGDRGLNGIIYFNTLIFSLALVYFAFLAGKKFDNLKGFLAGLTLMLFPFFIFSARNPGNGFTPVALFLVFLSILYFYDLGHLNWLKISILGFSFGLILSMLFVYATVALPILLLVFLLLKDKKLFLFFLGGMAAAFSPLVLFELKNNFVMLKNTFVDRSYLSFINNTNLPNGVKLNKNIFVNALDLSRKISPFININLTLMFGFLALSFSWIKKNKERYFIFSTFLGFASLVLMLRFQYSSHYLTPFITLLVFTLLIVILNARFSKTLLILVISTSVFFFPKSYYFQGTRNFQTIKNRVEKTLTKNWLRKNDSFNVLLIREDDAPTPAGFEYRYFFIKNQYEPKSEFLYGESKKLIVFTEKKDVDLSKLNSWEMSQFDFKKVKKISHFYPDPEMAVYLLER